MGKGKVSKKKNSMAQLKISNYFKKISEPGNKCQPSISTISSTKLSTAINNKKEDENVSVIILDDSITSTPKSRKCNDSSLEFIAATPESDKKSFFFSNVTKNESSPEIFPPTPMPAECSKLRICANNKFTTVGIKTTLISSRNQSSFGIKRRADSKTGMSPIAKKVENCNSELISDNRVKKNILNDFILSSNKAVQNENENSNLIQPFLKSIKIPLKRSKSQITNDKLRKNYCNDDFKSKIVCNVEMNCIDSSSDMYSKLKDKDETFPCKGNKMEEEKNETFPCKGNTMEEEKNETFPCKGNKMEEEKNETSVKGEINFDKDDGLLQFITDNIDQMSPFKNKPIQDESKWNNIYEKEKIGLNSFSAIGNYNRHLVTFIDKNVLQNKLTLNIKSLLDGRNAICNLSGFWYDTPIKEGDIVNLLMVEEKNCVYDITNTQGLLILNPDVLISGTSVVSGVFCRRKAVLNEKFKGVEGGNRIMLIGTLVHELFQKIVYLKDDNICFEDLINKLVIEKQILVALYDLKITEGEIANEIRKFLPAIEKWRNVYTKGINSCGKDEWKGKVCKVIDIEENVWSPRYGIKGKIDLTVHTISNGLSKVMPLELKTGKSTYSAEHRGQVTLYSMMTSDRRDDPEAGLLLYLKNLSMKEIPAGEKEKKGLMQLRNELVSYLYQKLQDKMMLPRLPDPLDNERLCKMCPQIVSCSTLLTVQKEVPQGEHSMSKIAPNTVAHLSQTHLDYFRHWCLLLHLENWKENGNIKNKALWCKNAEEREEMGECISQMHLSIDKLVEKYDSTHYIHYFTRDCDLHGQIPQKNFIAGDSIIISSTNEIGLAIGVVTGIDEKGVTVLFDKNLQKYPLWKNKIFRMDRCEYQSTMSIIYTNLVSLLEKGDQFDKLRQIIVNRCVPKFSGGLDIDKSKISSMKPLLKNLNTKQQRAAMRALLADDYLIIKGFPGTGKTSTIVCLVRLLLQFGFSVLLTSYTHSAIDTLLLKLKEYDDCPFLRIGKLARINPDLHQYSEDVLLKDIQSVEDVTKAYNSKPVVATTCLAVNHPIFRHRLFDYCIIDEAAQVLQPAALGPLFKCKKFVLVGDSLQLPPVIQSLIARKEGMAETLLERLDCEAGTFCLTEQYRMNEEIQRIANRLTYNGQLNCATEAVAKATLPVNTDEQTINWLSRATSSDIENSVVFIDTNGSSPEGRDQSNHPTNSGEKEVINRIVGELVRRGISRDDIGIITPYRGQVNLLKSTVEMVEINTVDLFQGRDKLAILFSCVKSSSNIEIKKTEILNDERRLNVAITRAKCKLVFVGDKSTLKFYTPFEKLFDIINPDQLIILDEPVKKIN